MAVFLSPIGNGAQYFTTGGLPLNGGFLNTYQAGTTTPQATFTTNAGNVANPVSIPLGTDGRPPAEIWLTDGIAYKFILTDSLGAQVGPPMDNISGIGSGGTTSTSLASSSGASLVGWIQAGIGAVLRLVQDKLRERVSVEDFGAVGDGVTDDSAAFQLALNAVGNGGIVTYRKSHYLGSTITIPANVTLRGPLSASGEQLFNNWKSDQVVGTLFLLSSATINLGAGASLENFQLLNFALRGALPFANLAAANTAVAAFAGTAITVTGPDAMIDKGAVGGFAQAYICDTHERPKVDWLIIDCTAGILTNNIFDIPRFQNVQCWAFLTAHQFSNVPVSLRSGAAYKTTGHFDGGQFLSCFSYGWLRGFDIASDEAVALVQCFADYYGSGTNNGQIGYKFSGAADLIQMIGCGSSGQDNGVYVNTTGKVSIIGSNFWGNKQHIVSDQHSHLLVNSCNLRDVNGTWSGNYAVVVSNTCTGTTNVNSNHFSSNTGYSIANVPLERLTTYGNTFDATAADTIGTRHLFDNTSNTITYSVFNASGNGNNINYRHAAGTAAAPTVSPAGVQVGLKNYLVYTGSAFGSMGSTRVQSFGGNPGAGSTPGAWVWSTTAIGSVTYTDRMMLTNAGVFMPMTDNTYTLGQSANRWSAVWAANGTIQTSDARTKKDITSASLGLDFINALRPVSYKWIEGSKRVIRQEVNEDGSPGEIITESVPGTRTHWGLIAQEVKAVCDAAGVDFGGHVLTDINDPDSQQALRYDQFVAPLIKAVQELTARVQALEAR